jgi:hypothetical protein
MNRFAIPWAIALLAALSLAAVPTAALDFNAADLDGDGRVTLEDLKALGRDVNTHAAAYRGDVTGDNTVDEADVRALARALVQRVAGNHPVSDAAPDRETRGPRQEPSDFGSSRRTRRT